ncbi:MAG: imidazolonepropionase [Oscillospiraceae bacterium]|nr:imidazolonepropionase [Oscillospiraceae bacterium]
MKKRKYTKVEAMEAEIMEMRGAGKTRREIGEQLGSTLKQVETWITRDNRKQAKLAAGIIPRPKGRARGDAAPENVEAEQAYEINRLRMENKLLRDFLQLTGRK